MTCFNYYFKMINKRSPYKIVACNLSVHCTDKTIDICALVCLQAVTINISLRDISDFKLIEELHWLGNLPVIFKNHLQGFWTSQLYQLRAGPRSLVYVDFESYNFLVRGGILITMHVVWDKTKIRPYSENQVLAQMINAGLHLGLDEPGACLPQSCCQVRGQAGVSLEYYFDFPSLESAGSFSSTSISSFPFLLRPVGQNIFLALPGLMRVRTNLAMAGHELIIV